MNFELSSILMLSSCIKLSLLNIGFSNHAKKVLGCLIELLSDHFVASVIDVKNFISEFDDIVRNNNS